MTIPNDIGVISSNLIVSLNLDKSSITTVTIGGDVAIIEPGAFSETNVESIEVSKGKTTPKYISKDGVIFTADEKELVVYPPGKNAGGNYIIPEGTTTLVKKAFAGASITSVTVSSTITTIGEDVFTNSSITSLIVPKEFISFTSNPEIIYSNKNIFYVFESDFTNDTLDITLEVNISSSNIDEGTKGRFILWGEEKKESMTTFTVRKETKEYNIKTVYKDGDKVIDTEGGSIIIRVIMNYLTSQTVWKLESTPFVYPIDETFTVSVKTSESDNWETVTTSSNLAVLGQDRNTIVFKEKGIFSLRVSSGNKILTEESITVESSVEVDGTVCRVTNSMKDITSEMLGQCSNATILVIPESVTSIKRDALSSILNTLKGIVIEGDSNIEPESCDFGKYEDKYNHIPVFRVKEKGSPTVALPTWNGSYKSNWDIPILWYSHKAGEILSITGGRNHELTSSGTGYQFYTISLNAGKYNIEGEDIKLTVVDWDESEKNCGEEKELVVPYGVYKISYNQYISNMTIQSVKLPPTIKIIDDYAFNQCSTLSSATLHEGLKTIGENVFDSSDLLTSIDVPASVESIGSSAFESCSGLTSVALHEELRLIDTWAFASTGLESVEVPAGVECINDGAFS